MKGGRQTPQLLQAENRLTERLSCKQGLPFKKKDDDRGEVGQGAGSGCEPGATEDYSWVSRPKGVSLARFQNCWGLVTFFLSSIVSLLELGCPELLSCACHYRSLGADNFSSFTSSEVKRNFAPGWTILSLTRI